MPQNRKIKTAFLILVAVFLAGMMGYHLLEGWTFLESLYATVITLATVGYGDYAPRTPVGRIFTIVLIIFGVGTTAYFVTLFIENLVEGRLRKVLGRDKVEKHIRSLKNHYIICGYGKVGRLIARELSQEGADFVIVEKEPETLPDIEDTGYLFVRGNATEDETLKNAGVERAKALASVLPTDAENLYVVLTAKELNPSIYIISRFSEGESSQRRLLKAGADRVMSPYEEGGMRMALAILKPAMLDFIELTTSRQSLALRMEEITICKSSSIIGRSLEESGMRRDFGLIVVAIEKVSGTMIFNPEASYIIEEGDNLIALGKEQDLARFSATCG